MKTLRDVQIHIGRADYISLSLLMGQVVDVLGFITNEFGDPTFQISRILLADGKCLYAEGEHDCPYLINGTAEFDGEQLQFLYKEQSI